MACGERRRMPSYVCDVNYVTPQPLHPEEVALRDAVVRNDVDHVLSLLSACRAINLVIGGGTVDVAILSLDGSVSRGGWYASDGGEGMAERSLQREKSDSRVSHSRSTKKFDYLRRDNDDTDSDSHNSDGGEDGDQAKGRALLRAERQRRRSDDVESKAAIVVPASSLPASVPPMLQQYGDTPPLDVTPSDHLSVHSAAKPAVGSEAGTREDAFLATTRCATIRHLLDYRLLDSSYCGPVCVAVRTGALDAVELLLQDARFDPNIGCPLRLCVQLERREALELLLKCPRINPNHGFPLHCAVEVGALWAIRALLLHPGCHVNRFATGTASTPLIAAMRGCEKHRGGVDGERTRVATPTRYVYGSSSAQHAFHVRHPSSLAMSKRDGAPAGKLGDQPSLEASKCVTTSLSEGTDVREEIFRLLAAHSYVDVNKGFASTPLQIAVAAGSVTMVRALLSRPTLAVNRAIGLFPCPLRMALDNDDLALAKVLLQDPRVYVTEDMVNALEEENNVAMLQLIAAMSQDVRVGYLWSMRCLSVVALTTLLWGACMADASLLWMASRLGERVLATVVLTAHVLACVVSVCVLVKKRPPIVGLSLWLVVPMLPLFESCAAWRIVYGSVAVSPDLHARQRFYERFQLCSRSRSYTALLISVPARLAAIHQTGVWKGHLVMGTLVSCATLVVVTLMTMFLKLPPDRCHHDDNETPLHEV